MNPHRFGDLDGTPIDRAGIRLSGGGSITRLLDDDEPIALLVYGHAGLPAMRRNADDELVRVHSLKPTYVAELTPELIKTLAGKRTTNTIIDAVREVYDGTLGVARLPMDEEPAGDEDEPDA
jgi:hypothetical protein